MSNEEIESLVLVPRGFTMFDRGLLNKRATFNKQFPN
jgi:hypothetical protein